MCEAEENDCSAFGRLDGDDVVLVEKLRWPVGRLPGELPAKLSNVAADQHACAKRQLGLVRPRPRSRELDVTPLPPPGGACGCGSNDTSAKHVSADKEELTPRRSDDP